MGLCWSQKSKCFDRDSEFIIFKHASSFYKGQRDEHIQPAEQIVELLYKLPDSQRRKQFGVTPSVIIKDEKSKTTQLTLSEKATTQNLKQPENLTKLKHSFTNNSAETTNEISCASKQAQKLEPDVNMSLKAVHLKGLKLPWKITTGSKISLEENLTESLSKEQNELSLKNSLQESKMTDPNTSVSSKYKKSPSKSKRHSLKISPLPELPEDCRVLKENQTYVSKFVDSNGRAVYMMIFRKSSQSVFRKFFNKMSSKTLSLNRKRESIGNYLKRLSSRFYIPKESRAQSTLRTDLSKDNDASQCQSSSLNYGSLPYQSSSLTIIPSKSFSSEKEPLSEIEISEPIPQSSKRSSKVLILNHKSSNKSIQTPASMAEIKPELVTENIPSTMLGAMDLQNPAKKKHEEYRPKLNYSNKHIQTQKRQSNIGTNSECMIDPSQKFVNVLKSKYRKKFKTMDELMQMPPKEMILFITSGELPDSSSRIHPTKGALNYEEFLNSITSGI